MQNQEFLTQRPTAEILSEHVPIAVGAFALASVSHLEPYLKEISEWHPVAREIGESIGHPWVGVLSYVFVEAFLYSRSALSRNTKILAAATMGDVVLEVGFAKFSGEPVKEIISSSNFLENLKDYLATLSGIGACALNKLRLQRKRSGVAA